MRSPVWHPFTQHGLDEPIVKIDRTEGAYLYTPDGRAVLDAISSWWVTTHGRSHPRIVAAIASAAQQYDQVIFAGFTHDAAESLAAGLLKLVPDALAHVFYTDSGSTSVEVALKMALGYWRNIGEPRHRIVVMEHSYHGDTIGAMSVGQRGIFNQAYAPLLFDVERIPFPRSGCEQLTIDALEKLCAEKDLPAALIVEPLILGAGGMLIYPAEVLRAMAEVCRRYGLLFIADEIMTGWGRTGTLFAFEQARIIPDILCLSKGLTGGSLPLAATLCTSQIFDAHYSKDPARQFFHSSSYTANPIACAAACANLDVWNEEPVMERVENLTRLQSACLQRLRGVEGVRQIGAITAFDVAGAGEGYLASVGRSLRASMLHRDILLRPLGNTLYVMPPYCINEAELERVYDALIESLAELRF